jgi:hypothetical protein
LDLAAPDLLKSKKRDLKIGDMDVEECAICMEDFVIGDGKQVAELNCHQKHIFHL